VGLTLTVAGIFYLAQEYFFRDFADLGARLGLAPDHAYFKFMSDMHDFFENLFATVTGVAVLVATLGGIELSHRIAGPVIRLRNHMRAVAEGKTRRPVEFREGDFFADLAESYNAQLARLNLEPPVDRPQNGFELRDDSRKPPRAA
jgi:hypothetical protein